MAANDPEQPDQFGHDRLPPTDQREPTHRPSVQVVFRGSDDQDGWWTAPRRQLAAFCGGVGLAALVGLTIFIAV